MKNSTIGALIGYGIACLIYGQLLPALSAPAIVGVFIGVGSPIIVALIVGLFGGLKKGITHSRKVIKQKTTSDGLKTQMNIQVDENKAKSMAATMFSMYAGQNNHDKEKVITETELSGNQTSEKMDNIQFTNQISPSSIKKPQKGDLVCSRCGYIVGVGKPPKHTLLGGLICPTCQGIGFYMTE